MMSFILNLILTLLFFLGVSNSLKCHTSLYPLDMGNEVKIDWAISFYLENLDFTIKCSKNKLLIDIKGDINGSSSFQTQIDGKMHQFLLVQIENIKKSQSIEPGNWNCWFKKLSYDKFMIYCNKVAASLKLLICQLKYYHEIEKHLTGDIRVDKETLEENLMACSNLNNIESVMIDETYNIKDYSGFERSTRVALTVDRGQLKETNQFYTLCFQDNRQIDCDMTTIEGQLVNILNPILYDLLGLGDPTSDRFKLVWSPCITNLRDHCTNVPLLEHFKFKSSGRIYKIYESPIYTLLFIGYDSHRVYMKIMSKEDDQMWNIQGKRIYLRSTNSEPQTLLDNVNFSWILKVQEAYSNDQIYPMESDLNTKDTVLSFIAPYNHCHSILANPKPFMKLLSEHKGRYAASMKCQLNGEVPLNDLNLLMKTCHHDPVVQFIKHFPNMAELEWINAGLNVYISHHEDCLITGCDIEGNCSGILNLEFNCRNLIGNVHSKINDMIYYKEQVGYKFRLKDNQFGVEVQFAQKDFISIYEVIKKVQLNFAHDLIKPIIATISYSSYSILYRIKFNVFEDMDAVWNTLSDSCTYYRLFVHHRYTFYWIRGSSKRVGPSTYKGCDKFCKEKCETLEESVPNWEAINKYEEELILKNSPASDGNP